MIPNYPKHHHVSESILPRLACTQDNHSVKSVQMQSFSWSVFSGIWIEYRDSVQIRENMDQKKLRIWNLLPQCMRTGAIKDFQIYAQRCKISSTSFFLTACRSYSWIFIKKQTLALLLSCEFCEISQNTFFFTEHSGDCFFSEEQAELLRISFTSKNEGIEISRVAKWKNIYYPECLQ